jgi:hypothetical protein
MTANALINKMSCLICILFLSGLLSACMSRIKYGVSPQVEKLDSLTVGVSSKPDVLMTLGKPRGYGASRFSNSALTKHGITNYYEIWFYEYAESDGSNVQLKFLLVFMDRDRYSGHFWFSSSELLEREE